VAPGRRLAVVLAVGLISPSAAGGQVLPTLAAPTHELRLDGARLPSGQFEYSTVLERDAVGIPLGTRLVSAQLSAYAGTRAWLIMESRLGDAIPAIDSLFADQTTLRPIHWGATIGRARLSAEFRGDTVYGGTNSPAGRRSMVLTLPAGAVVNGAMLETMLRILPLQTGWEDSTYMLSVSLSSVTTMPARIAVIGEDRIRVPAGEYDCWIVSVRAGEVARGLYWVSKREPLVVRSALEVPGMNEAQYVSSLTRVVR
jgi:hypothetical protein